MMSVKAISANLVLLAHVLYSGQALGVEYFGYPVGTFKDANPGVFGQVFIVDKTTVYLANFTLPMEKSDTFIYAGTLNTDGSYTEVGYPLSSLQGRPAVVSGSGEPLIVQFPQGKSLYSVDWLGIIDKRQKKMLGRVLVTDSVKLNIPRPQQLGPLQGRGKATASDVILLDSKSIMVKDFTFQVSNSDAYFMVGRGFKANEQGIQLPDEKGSREPLKSYSGKSIILTLPSPLDVYSIDWFAVWSSDARSSLGEIDIPRTLTVPPAPSDLGIRPQAKLNCEVLSSDLGLEIRWSINDAYIIMQIAGNIGSEMYMALGIKPNSRSGLKTQGDVAVGWINAATGEGGVDDYFLSGTEVCSDGAESCPDTTKQGGSKDIEMLNSVSRNNYTMITFRRPVISKDDYDVSISTNDLQEIFWSVGYKKAEMRIKHKPLKNKDPIFISFGRTSQWNCPRKTKAGRRKAHQQQEQEPKGNLKKQGIKVRRIDSDYLYESDLGPDDNFRASDVPQAGRPDIVASPKDHRLGDQSRLSIDGPGLYPVKNSIEDYEKRIAKLAPQISQREDGQLTTLELIPELGDFVEPFFPKGPPPPGAAPPPPPPGPATHPPPALDSTWQVPTIGCNSSDETVFYLQIGPAAGGKGNQGLSQFGQAWYVNGDLAPELYLVKGTQYTFIVEGGLGTDPQGTFHPFYLTSDSEGGYGTKSDYEANLEDVFGGLSRDRDGLPVPKVMGRLCEFRAARPPPTFATYQDFKENLKLECQDTGSPGVLRFTPGFDLPPSIYYQSFSEKMLGGKIHLLEQCHEIFKSDFYKRKQNKVKKTTFDEKKTTTINKMLIKDKNSGDQRKANKLKTKFGPIKETQKKVKCDQKRSNSGLTPGGMPEFPHFPVTDILKEGIEQSSEDDCDNVNDGGSHEWNDYDDYYDDDYVQPTRRPPLVFTENVAAKYPLKGKNSASSSGNLFPRLPSLFNNLPSFEQPFFVRDTERADNSLTTSTTSPQPPPRDLNLPYSGQFGQTHSPVSLKATTTQLPFRSTWSPFSEDRQTKYPPFRVTTPSSVFDQFQVSHSRRPSTVLESTVRTPISRVSTPPSWYEPLSTRPVNPSQDKVFIDYEAEYYDDNYDYEERRPFPDRKVVEKSVPEVEHRPVARPRPKPEPTESYAPSVSPAIPPPLAPPRNFHSFFSSGTKFKKGLRRNEGGPQLRKRPRPHKEFRPKKKMQEMANKHVSRPKGVVNGPLSSLINPIKKIFSGGVLGNSDINKPKSSPSEAGSLKGAYLPAPLPPPHNFPQFNLPEPADRRAYNVANKPSRSWKSTTRHPYPMVSPLQHLYNPGDPERQYEGSRIVSPLYSDQEYAPSEDLTTTSLQEDVRYSPKLEDVTTVGSYEYTSRGIQAESGFKPIMPGDLSSKPLLAFSVYDSESNTLAEDQFMDRMDVFQDYEDDEATEIGDRGHVVVDIPDAVLPYVPPHTVQRSLEVGHKEDNVLLRQSVLSVPEAAYTSYDISDMLAQSSDMVAMSSERSVDTASFAKRSSQGVNEILLNSLLATAKSDTVQDQDSLPNSSSARLPDSRMELSQRQNVRHELQPDSDLKLFGSQDLGAAFEATTQPVSPRMVPEATPFSVEEDEDYYYDEELLEDLHLLQSTLNTGKLDIEGPDPLYIDDFWEDYEGSLTKMRSNVPSGDVERPRGAALESNTHEPSSADFSSFQVVANPDAEIKIRKVHEVILPPNQDVDTPLLVSIGGSLNYNPKREEQGVLGAVGSVSEPDFFHLSDRQQSKTESSSSFANGVVYGKSGGGIRPSSPLESLLTINANQAEKLNQMESLIVNS